MNTKLTLSVKKETVRKIKRYAKEKGTSVSNLAEKSFDQMLKNGKQRTKESAVSRLRGILKGKVPDNIDYKDLIASWRSEKHGI